MVVLKLSFFFTHILFRVAWMVSAKLEISASRTKFSKRYFELQFISKFQILVPDILLQNLKDTEHFIASWARFRSLVRTVMKLLVPQKVGDCLNS
jgi:hypothetical protein